MPIGQKPCKSCDKNKSRLRNAQNIRDKVMKPKQPKTIVKTAGSMVSNTKTFFK